MAKRAAPQRVTKKHLARAQREQRQRAVILSIAIGITIIVSGLLLFGVVGNFVTPVAVVNGENISAGDFRGRVRLAQADIINQAIFQDQTEGLQARLDDAETLGQSVLNQIIDEVLIRQEVERKGETVTEGEIESTIAEAFGYYPEGTSTPFPTFTPNPTLTALAAITPTTTEGPTPTSSPTITPGPSPTITPTRTPLPTATEYTEEAYLENYEFTLDGLDLRFNVSEKYFREQFRAQLYRKKLFDFFENEVPRIQEHVNARHILVEEEETALEVLAQLTEGESFEAMALEYSTDESNKERAGALGWFARGRMVDDFETAVFNAEVGLIAEPIQTSFGWHIVEILELETRELDVYGHQLAVQTAFNSWLIDIHTEAAIEISKNWVDRLPDPPNIGGFVPPQLPAVQ